METAGEIKWCSLKIERYEDFNVARLSTPDQLEQARNWAVKEPFDLIVVHHEMLWEFAFDIATNRSKPCVLVVHVLQAAMNRVRNIEERTMSLVWPKSRRWARRTQWRHRRPCTSKSPAQPKLKGKLYRLGLGIHRVAEQAKTAFEPTVVFSGRFDSIKRLSLYWLPWKKVVQVIPDAKLIVMGGNPGNPKVERRWHRRLNSEVSAELRSRMTVTGWLHEGEIWQYLAQASIVALPSLYETFGLSVLEAMAQGLATVANPVGLKELVQHERSGLWVDSNEPEPWANALIGLLKQPDLALEMGETARRAVLGELALERSC